MRFYDYCIIGTGLDGLVFADTMLTHSDATIAVIDSSARAPQSRQRDAAILSRALPADRIGLASYTLRDWREEFHRASVNKSPTSLELHAYSEYVLKQRLIPTGRLERLTDVKYLGNGRFRSSVNANETLPRVRRRVVHTQQASQQLAHSCGRNFTVAARVHVVKPRILRAHAEMKHRSFDQYCVIGAGPVGTEIVLALLDLDIPPAKIKWVKPREGWMLAPPDRPTLPSAPMAVQCGALQAMADAQNTADLSRRLERLGVLTHASSDQMPNHILQHMISKKDVTKLRHVTNIVRKGHVHAISEIGMVLSQGAEPMPHRTLYLDCTGQRTYGSDTSPIFTEATIELSPVRLAQPSFSAALIGAIELSNLTVSQKNALCAPIYGANLALCFLTSLLNHHAWFHNRDIRYWLETCRLDQTLQATAQKLNASEQVPADLKAVRAILPRAIINLESLAEQTGAVGPLSA